MSDPSVVVTGVTAAASGVLGGAFFAFSSFVMPGLRALPARDGIAAMQGINEAAPRSLLMLPLLASALGSAVVGVQAVATPDLDQRGLRITGAALGLAALVITGVANVPRNNALAAVDPSAPSAEASWSDFLTGWTRWNHARTVASIGSAVALAVSVCRSG
jgi:uncharacterized membrane protein